MRGERLKIKVGLSIGFVADRDDEIEVEDDLTDEEIEIEVRDWANNYIETWWEKVPK